MLGKLEEEDVGDVLVVLESAGWGCVALILTSVCLKEALLASMRETGTNPSPPHHSPSGLSGWGYQEG